MLLKNHKRDPFSGYSHMTGAILSVLATVIMVLKEPSLNASTYLVSYIVFGLSMTFMFAASTVYHLYEGSDATIRHLKRIDHIAIYVMIAGSYTPFCLLGLDSPLAWQSTLVIWVIALCGIGLKIFWLGAPRWLSTLLYLVMGWLSLIIYEPLSQNLSDAAINWLVIGGIWYSVGAIIYATKWPNFHKHFGFHELWHIFVLGGATSHFISIAYYL
jgi:hemolysin III